MGDIRFFEEVRFGAMKTMESLREQDEKQDTRFPLEGLPGETTDTSFFESLDETRDTKFFGESSNVDGSESEAAQEETTYQFHFREIQMRPRCFWEKFRQDNIIYTRFFRGTSHKTG